MAEDEAVTRELKVSSECRAGSGQAPEQTQGPAGKGLSLPRQPSPSLPLSPSSHPRLEQSHLRPESHCRHGSSHTAPLPRHEAGQPQGPHGPMSQLRAARLQTEGTQPAAVPEAPELRQGPRAGVGTRARVSGPNTHTKSRGDGRHLLPKRSLDLASLLTCSVALGQSPPRLRASAPERA